MSNITRRDFIKITATASTGLLINACGKGKLSPYSDLVLLNGHIITVDATDSLADSVAVKNGLIEAVGKGDDLQANIGPETTVLDLGGKTVTPGLVDSHIHVIQYGKQ